MMDSGPGPITLRPIKWGTKDRALGFAVTAHIRDATPPTVIQWSPIENRLKQQLRRSHIHTTTAIDDARVADKRLAYKGVFPGT